MIIRNCKTINGGCVEGEALVTRESISFLGGIDPKTGIVTERGHEIEGECIKDKIFIFPQGKGSTLGSYIIYSLKKEGNAPLAIINSYAEPIVVVGAIVSDIPMVECDLNVKTGDRLIIDSNTGIVEIKE